MYVHGEPTVSRFSPQAVISQEKDLLSLLRIWD